jgi:hypothetical protein
VRAVCKGADRKLGLEQRSVSGESEIDVHSEDLGVELFVLGRGKYTISGGTTSALATLTSAAKGC